jgi:predicted TIM-barrel fold metal-dependent hydrolase
VIGFHFHPIMGHFSVDDPKLNPLFETISGLGVPVMVDTSIRFRNRGGLDMEAGLLLSVIWVDAAPGTEGSSP